MAILTSWAQVFSNALAGKEGVGSIKEGGVWGKAQVSYSQSEKKSEPIQFVPLSSMVKFDVLILNVDTVRTLSKGLVSEGTPWFEMTSTSDSAHKCHLAV